MIDENNRVAARSRVLKGAKIVCAKDWSVIDCKVRDFSDSGAKLTVGDQVIVPQDFMLFMSSDRTLRDVRVVWKKENSLGVAFVGPARPAPPRKF